MRNDTNQVIFKDWTFNGVSDLTGFERVSILAALQCSKQLVPEFLTDVFHFDGTISIDTESQIVWFKPYEISGWRIKGIVPLRDEAKRLAAVLESNSFTSSDIRNIFSKTACVIDEEAQEICIWTLHGAKELDKHVYSFLEENVLSGTHHRAEAIRRVTGHSGPIHIDESRYEITFFSLF